MLISLFIGCYNDTLFPDTGKAVVAVLERLGHEVEFRAAQTCCGQMHYNTGYAAEALPVLRHFVKTFADAAVICVPSASCVAMMRDHYPKMAAETGPCGLWPEDIGPTYDPVYATNRPHWNHGCASQRNLAAQVANPADLVQPRAEGPALASRRATAIEKYRKGEGTATQYPDANKGKISDIGQ